MINEKQLRKAATELQKVMLMKPPIDVEAPLKELTELVKEAISQINPVEDSFSAATLAVIKEFDPTVFPEEEEEEEEVVNGLSLGEEIEATDDLTELKTIAKGNDEFKSIRMKLNSYKTADELKETLLDILADEAEVKQEKAEELHEKNIATKSTKGTVAGKGKPAADKPVVKKAPGAVPANFKKEGSYAEFMDNLVKAGGTWDELFTEAQEEAEKRGKKTTVGAIRAHTKFRLSKDAKFLGKLNITDNGIE